VTKIVTSIKGESMRAETLRKVEVLEKWVKGQDPINKDDLKFLLELVRAQERALGVLHNFTLVMQTVIQNSEDQ
jgi:hypothetical protein